MSDDHGAMRKGGKRRTILRFVQGDITIGDDRTAGAAVSGLKRRLKQRITGAPIVSGIEWDGGTGEGDEGETRLYLEQRISHPVNGLPDNAFAGSWPRPRHLA